MTARSGEEPSAAVLLDALEEGGATHLVGLPDSTSAPLLDLARARGRTAVVPVTREGEAFAVASGLWLGGATPVVVIQNTGLLESGDALRGTAARMGVPLLTLVTWRGHARMVAAAAEIGPPLPTAAASRTPPVRTAGSAPADPRPSREDLVRPDVDSVALLTTPTLAAWGVPLDRYAADADTVRLRDLWARARREERPVALLLPRRLH